MLSQVERATRKNEAIVFHGWKPHWMDLKYDIRFLEADPESKLAGMKTTIYTIVADGWPEKNAQASKFLKQFDVPVAAQSKWIAGFARDERPVEEVASEWISSNMDTVAKWVGGVESANGGSGIDAVRQKFGG
jgi:glycine betaine/proline transport system substrate-binding protein